MKKDEGAMLVQEPGWESGQDTVVSTPTLAMMGSVVPVLFELLFLPSPSAPVGGPLQPSQFYGSRSVTKDFGQNHSFLERYSIHGPYYLHCKGRRFHSHWSHPCTHSIVTRFG